MVMVVLPEKLFGQVILQGYLVLNSARSAPSSFLLPVPDPWVSTPTGLRKKACQMLNETTALPPRSNNPVDIHI